MIFLGLRILYEIREFRAASATDPLPGGGLIFEMLGHKEKILFQSWNELLCQNPDQLGGEEGGGILPLLGSEDTVKPLHRFRCAAAMERGDHEMPGFRRLKGGVGRNGVPDLTQQDDVGALAKGASESFRKAGGIGADFPLGKATEMILKQVFDRVFDGDDVAGCRLVQPFQPRSHGGRFSRTGGSGHQNETGRTGKPLLENGNGQAQLLHGGNLSLDAPEDGTPES